jgi:hypothetical protein
VPSGVLPAQAPRNYDRASACVYCLSGNDLTDEHIVPLGLGGRLVYPRASCRACSVITGAFEGAVLRSMFGPLRMFYDFPSRRKSERPPTLPLKVKHTANDDWTEIQVPRSEYPFLILMPYLSPPTFVAGRESETSDARAQKFWIRGVSEGSGFNEHLEEICRRLGVHSVMPTGQVCVPEFCRMLAKIAHSFASAECGPETANWLLRPMILSQDFSRRGTLMGTVTRLSSTPNKLHEIHMVEGPDASLSVQLQLLAVMDAPTYLIKVGDRVA